MDGSRFFSDQLNEWFKGKQPKTLAGLVELFEEKSFAVVILLLMILPATPLPTGGVTHVFEIITILLSLEMVWGRETLWLPRRWQNVDVSGIGRQKVFMRIVGWLNWVERHSRRRLPQVIERRGFRRIAGALIAIFCLTALLAPPFSGLDTLPSLAVVLIALSIILEDILLYIIGIVAGSIGIGTVITLGGALFESLRRWLF